MDTAALALAKLAINDLVEFLAMGVILRRPGKIAVPGWSDMPPATDNEPVPLVCEEGERCPKCHPREAPPRPAMAR
jgi:hypothetical protein